MSAKRLNGTSSKTAASKSKALTMKATFPEPDEKARAMASLAVSPHASAAVVIADFNSAFGTQEPGALFERLAESVEMVQGGDLKQCEAMLVSQAHALQSIFTNMARRAACSERLQHIETFMRMALKAQSQCRTTLETLANIKNPPVMFAKQANISNGPQQVNNGMAAQPGPFTHAHEEKTIPSNQVLEVSNGERLDTRAPGAAGGADQDLEAVGALDGAAHARRKTGVQAQPTKARPAHRRVPSSEKTIQSDPSRCT
jgi:hypothetical protein